jgi:hypothetical protein
MIKFKLFGPKVCSLGHVRLLGRCMGARLGNRCAPYGIKCPPYDLAPVAVCGGRERVEILLHGGIEETWRGKVGRREICEKSIF